LSPVSASVRAARVRFAGAVVVDAVVSLWVMCCFLGLPAHAPQLQKI
jgi:hypothetical protein